MHIENFDLNLLTVFEAVYETGHVGQAAERLRLSQPAVSHALGRLREQTRDELFRRQGRRMTPTARAEALAGPVRAALAQVRQAFAAGAGALQGERTLRCKERTISDADAQGGRGIAGGEDAAVGDVGL